MKKNMFRLAVGLITGLGILLHLCLWGMPLTDKQAGSKPYKPNSPDRYENYLLVHYFLHQEQYDKAEALIDQYLQKNPDDPFLLTEKAFILSEIKGKHEEAMNLLKKSLVIYPDYYFSNYLYAFILFTLYDPGADSAAKDKKYIDEAVKHLELALKDNPEHYDSYYLLGIILNARGDYAESNRYLKEANNLEQTAAAYLYMASNYKHLDDNDNAIKSYQEILSFNPANFRALSALSEFYMEKKDYKTALNYLEKLFLSYPRNRKIAIEYLFALIAGGEEKRFMDIAQNVDISDSPVLLYARALLLTREEKFSEAEQLLEKIQDKDLKAHLLLAEIHLQRDNYYQAYRALEKIEPKERDSLYYSVLLRTLLTMNMNGRILKIFEVMKADQSVMEELDVSDLYAFLTAGIELSQPDKIREIIQLGKNLPGKPQELFSDLENSLPYTSPGKEFPKDLPRFPANISLMVSLLRQNRQFDQAAALIRRLMEKVSDSEDPYIELCDLYLEQKEFKKLERELKKLSVRFPGSLAVKNYYAYYLATQNKDLEHALELASVLIKQEGGNPAYSDTYGYILLRLGRTDEAGKYLENAYQKLPFEKEIMEHVVEYYRAKKDFQRVKDIYRKAIDSDVDFKDQLLKQVESLEHEQ